MIIQFNKIFWIGLCTLTAVSCAIPPARYPQPEPVPVINQKLDKFRIPATPSVRVPKPTPSIPSLMPPTQARIPTPPPFSQAVPTLPKPPIALLPTSLVSLRNISAVPGGIAWVSLSQSDTPPQISYKQHQVVVLRSGPNWVALIGIPLSAKPGRHTAHDQQTGERYSFRVKHKKYKTQRLRIRNKRKVNPSRQDLQRIRRESKLIKAALTSPWRATSTSPLPLMQPVYGRFSSPFGLRRYFNGQRRNPHSGLDIAAPQGTPVAAAGMGRVVNTGHYFFTGNTVFIDHGQGVVTQYGHLDTIIVSPGQTVESEQVIGTVGKTGRATGPHLHWGVSLNDTMVDPKLLMQ